MYLHSHFIRYFEYSTHTSSSFWTFIGSNSLFLHPFFLFYIWDFDLLNLPDSQLDPSWQPYMEPLLFHISTGGPEVSKDAKYVGLNFVEMCINDAQDSKNICIWCNSAAIKNTASWILTISLNMCAPRSSSKVLEHEYIGSVGKIFFIIQRTLWLIWRVKEV